MIAIKEFELENDYGVVSNWWAEHGYPKVPAYALSDDGFMAMYDNNPIAAVWAYTTDNSAMAWLEWVVSDPKADGKALKPCLLAMIEFAVRHCKAKGCNVILAHTDHKGIIKRCGEAGFTVSTSEIKSLVYTGGIRV